VCSWAHLDEDAHRTPSPLLSRLAERTDYVAEETPAAVPLASRLREPRLETLDDVLGVAVNTATTVRGGVKPLTLQAECGFHAYGEIRLRGARLEAPAPGIDPRDRGIILHKALEMIWIKLHNRFGVEAAGLQVLKPSIHDSVEAAVAYAYRGFVPVDLQPAVSREKMRIERLIEKLLQLELSRPAFEVDSMESCRQVPIACSNCASIASTTWKAAVAPSSITNRAGRARSAGKLIVSAIRSCWPIYWRSGAATCRRWPTCT
jgi:hypothetical protein